MNDKDLWNELARNNYKYYIVTNYGKHISDDRFDKSGYVDYEKYILKDEIITRKFPDKRQVCALEIGCGAGRLLKPMAKDFGTVIGTDVSDEMISRASDRVSNLKNITTIVTDGKSIPCSDNSVDFIFSYLVFQHIKEYYIIENYFKEIHRVLKPNGLFKVLLGCVKYRDMDAWYSGISFTELMISAIPSNFGYRMLKLEYTQDNRVWLWLEKPE